MRSAKSGRRHSLAADAARTERAEGERVFHSDRARSKARLIDALLVSGGVLRSSSSASESVSRLIPSALMAPANARGTRQSAKL
jgi:hypothetical protein